MADSAADRTRRARAHKRGDHSLCRPERCDVAGRVTGDVTPLRPAPETAVTPSDEDAGDRQPGEIEAEVAAFVAQLEFPEDDPRRILGRIAVKLARRVDAADATAAAIRQLTVLLSQLAEIPDQPAGPLDGVRARSVARRLGSLIRQAN